MNGTPAENKTKTCCYKNILVALDGSDYAEIVLAKAMELAALTPDSRITGVHVTHAPQDNQAKRIMEEAGRTCFAANIPFSQRILQGKEYRELLSESLSGEYDLLVIGYKGESGPLEEKLGGVCELVVRRAVIDTLVVGQSGKRHQHQFGPILVMVDGSENAMDGVWTALDLGRRSKRQVILATVCDSEHYPMLLNTIRKINPSIATESPQAEQWETLALQLADTSGEEAVHQKLLDVLAETLRDQEGVAISYELLIGKPDIAIRKFMLDKDPSLLIMGRTGVHYADASLKIGSLADKLLNTETCITFMTTCDMLIIYRFPPLIQDGDNAYDTYESYNTEQPVPATLEKGGANRKILIVDDESFHCEHMLNILSPYGDCDVAEDGVEAIELYEAALANGRAYDLVTLDVDMPVMDGHQTSRAIRSKEKEWDLPLGGRTAVIMVTSLSSHDHIDIARQDGCTNYFTKPIYGDKLLASIRKRMTLGKDAQPRNNKPRRIPKLDDVINQTIQPFSERWPDKKLRLFPVLHEERRTTSELSKILTSALKRAIHRYWNVKTSADHPEKQPPAAIGSNNISLRGVYSPFDMGLRVTLQFEDVDGTLLDSIEIKIDNDLIPTAIQV